MIELSGQVLLRQTAAVSQYIGLYVRVARLIANSTVNHEGGGSNIGCTKLIKGFQQDLNPKIACFFGSRLNLEVLCTTIIIVGTQKIHLIPFAHWLLGSVSLDV